MPEKLQALASAIKKKGFDWQAAQTSVSDLSASQQKAMLGLKVTKQEMQATEQAISTANALMAFEAPLALPSSVDWRSNSGNWVTPVKDQQSCGSCVSFATCATIESHVRLICRNASMGVDLSEAHLFFCGCGNCCGSGWNFPPALDFCKNTGVAKEAAFPYTPNDQPCKQGVPIWFKISSWNKALAINDRKTYLANTGPMIGGFAVYSDFYSYSTGVYRRTSSTLRGYHAISVIGYDDNQECWICKNSWGPGWGDAGFFKIGYGECQIDSSFGFYGVTLPRCPVTPVDICKRYLPFLRRVIRAAYRNRELRACLCYYLCGRRGRRPRCSRSTLRVVRMVYRILRRCRRYRAPFCRAIRC